MERQHMEVLGTVQLQESTFLFTILEAGTSVLVHKCEKIKTYSQSRIYQNMSRTNLKHMSLLVHSNANIHI